MTMDLSRISYPTDEDKARIEKYSRAVERIYDVLPMSSGLKGERIIKIDGCVTIQPSLIHDDFRHRSIRFIENHGWYVEEHAISIIGKALNGDVLIKKSTGSNRLFVSIRPSGVYSNKSLDSGQDNHSMSVSQLWTKIG